MKFKLKGSKNLLKIVLTLGISISLWNCEKEDYYEQHKEEFKIENASTVSFQDAIKHFELNKKNYDITNLALKGSDASFKVTPDWNTFEHKQIAYTDALLTTAKTDINRTGNYYSKLYFLNVNGTIRNVIFTTYIKRANAVGGIIDASVFFNKINGEFIDGYKIENGKFTKKYIHEETKTQKANLLSLFMFFQNAGDDEFWCNDGPLDEVDLGTIGSSSGSLTTPGNEAAGGFSSSYLWYITSGPGSYSYSSYINGATSSGISMPTSGGTTNTDNSLSGGQIDSAGAAILMVSPIDPNDDGSCPEGYKKNRTTGKCDPICSGGKIYNQTTQDCECPEGLVENKDGICIRKPCEGNPINNSIEIAPQKGISGALGAMFGNSNIGGCTRYGGTDCSTPKNKNHDGIDIKNSHGSPIFSMYDGFIYSSRYHKKAGWNIRVQSNVNGKTILISYFHLQKENRLLQTTSPLNYVKAGEIIGYQGDSGNLRNAINNNNVDSHVHIEVRVHNGSNNWSYESFELVDPREYLNVKINDDGSTVTNTNCNN